MKGLAEFETAVRRLFQHWDVLQHAVASQFGGSYSEEKAEWLPTAVVDYFRQNADLEASEVETFVSEIMDNEFDLLIEDGSLKTMSKQLCRCYGWARDERFEELKDFLSTLKPLPVSKVKLVENDNESDSGEDKECEKREEAEGRVEVDEVPANDNAESANLRKKSKNVTVVDEDGWTLVTGKKKH